MNWINGLHHVGVALVCVSSLGAALTTIYFIDTSTYEKPITWKRVYPSVAALLATLLAGAFMVGVAA